MADSTKNIRIFVDTKGAADLRKIADALGLVSKNTDATKRATQSTASTVRSAAAAFTSYFAALQVRELINMSDTMQLLNDRITVLAGGTDKAAGVMDQLLGAADRTKVSIDDLATVYGRFASALGDSGVSSAALLDMTEILQNTFRLSGTSAQEAAGASIQLSQAFALGTLRGQELRSVVSQNAEVAKLLRKEFGQDLFKKAEAGMISASKVMEILYKNADSINERAKGLGQTFGQTLTVAVNDFKVKILELNKEFDLSGKFATGVSVIQDKIGLIGVALGVLSAVILSTFIPALIAVITTLNPFHAALGVLALAFVTLFKNLDDFKIQFKQVAGTVLEAFGDFTKGFSFFNQFIPVLGILSPLLEKVGISAAGLGKKLKESAEDDRLIEQVRGIEAANDKLLDTKNKQIARERELEAARRREAERYKSLKEQLVGLNAQWNANKITIEEYYDRINIAKIGELNHKFKEGELDLRDYNEELEKFKKERHLELLSVQFKSGAITAAQYGQALRDIKLEDLSQKLHDGKISLNDYNEKLLEFSENANFLAASEVGVQSSLKSIGTYGQNIAKTIENAFGTLEEELFQATKNGEFNFSRFAQAVLDDMQRMIIKALILRPILQGIESMLTGGATAGAGAATTSAGGGYANYSTVAAKGAAFENGFQKFASGGIVDAPTPFLFGGGKRGLMGEAGTEAILPLARGGNGDLGVQASVNPVTVNIINQSGAEVTQKESNGPNGERVLDVVIMGKVKEGITSGSFDKAFGQAFGLKRKGS